MSGPSRVSVWFLCGLILLTYGLLLTGVGVYHLGNPPPAHYYAIDLHLDMIWGIVLTLAGSIFLWRQWPLE